MLLPAIIKPLNASVDDNPDASFLDLHMYMTSALRKSDVKAVGLQMALELMHEKSNKDVITGLKVSYS